MILVLLGTQDKPFTRLLQAFETACETGKLKDEKIVVQAGYTKFQSKYMEIFDYVEMEEFDQLFNEADVIVCHGGVGTIMQGLRKNKKVLATPRLAQYGEHHNDHQVQIIENFVEMGYIQRLDDFDHLVEAIEEVRHFEAKPMESNTANFIALIEEHLGLE